PTKSGFSIIEALDLVFGRSGPARLTMTLSKKEFQYALYDERVFRNFYDEFELNMGSSKIMTTIKYIDDEPELRFSLINFRGPTDMPAIIWPREIVLPLDIGSYPYLCYSGTNYVLKISSFSEVSRSGSYVTIGRLLIGIQFSAV
ncbi:MAG: hypothetical protein Harvfovirus27_24, partial [Harvfovirus sp.]